MKNTIWVIHSAKTVLVTDDIGGVPVAVCITEDNPKPGYNGGTFDDWQACQAKAIELAKEHGYPMHFCSYYWDADYWKHPDDTVEVLYDQRPDEPYKGQDTDQ